MYNIFLPLLLFFLGIAFNFWGQKKKAKWLNIAALIFFTASVLLTVAFGGYWFGANSIVRSNNLSVLPGSCAKYGIKIVSPKDGQDMPQEFEIAGTYENLPSEGHVLIYFSLTDIKQGYWPDSVVEFDKTHKTWSGIGKLLNKPPQDGFFYIILVGDSGRALYDYVMKVGTQSGWIPIDRLADDMDVCAKIYLKRTQ